MSNVRRAVLGLVAGTLIAAAVAVGWATTHRASHPVPATGIYGSGVAIDTKNNYQVGWTASQRVAHRFRAGTSSRLVSVAILQRGGSGYSGGDGGSMRIDVESDEAAVPSGASLASLTFSPANPDGNWERTDRLTFERPAALTGGVLYHIVFTNTSPAPTANYISVNEGLAYGSTTSPRQPAFDDDFAVLYDRGPGWAVAEDIPIMDLTYADGTHDGNAYVGIVGERFALISGADRLARERFTVTGPDRQVTSASVRVKRVDGTSPLTLRLETADGVELASAGVPAEAIPASSPPTHEPSDPDRWIEESLAGGVWVTATFGPPQVLGAGMTYALSLSTSSDTTYVVVPIREQDSESEDPWGSLAFRDGSGQSTTNGSEWADMYRFAPVDLQFYLR